MIDHLSISHSCTPPNEHIYPGILNCKINNKTTLSDIYWQLQENNAPSVVQNVQQNLFIVPHCNSLKSHVLLNVYTIWPALYLKNKHIHSLATQSCLKFSLSLIANSVQVLPCCIVKWAEVHRRWHFNEVRFVRRNANLWRVISCWFA